MSSLKELVCANSCEMGGIMNVMDWELCRWALSQGQNFIANNQIPQIDFATVHRCGTAFSVVLHHHASIGSPMGR